MPTTERSLRVLVVDDNRDGADALGLLLEELGNQVHVTYGGTQALDVATAFRPDLMLVDLVMPDMDGCGLVTRIRQIRYLRSYENRGHHRPERRGTQSLGNEGRVRYGPRQARCSDRNKSGLGQCRSGGRTAGPIAKTWPRSVRVSEQSDVCRLTKLDESGTSGNQELLLKQKARQPSVRGSVAFKRSIWDGGRSRFTPTSSKTSWWSAFSVF